MYNYHLISNRMKTYLSILSLVVLSVVSQPVAASSKQVGTIRRDTLLGVPCRVYLPYQYAERSSMEEAVFPVLYLQHGMFGSEDDWTEQGHLLRWMEMLLKAGQVKEMVVIMPDNFLGSIPSDERTLLMNAPNVTPKGESIDTSKGSAHWRKLTREQEQTYEMSGYWEEHFSEFMKAAENRYSINTAPGQRAIAGLSMGGFHTMHVAHYLYGQFAYVGLFSPVIIPRRGDEQVSPEMDSQYRTTGFDYQLEFGSPAYDNWMEEMRRMTSMPPMLWMAIGRDDFLYAQLQDFRMWLDQNNFEYTYYESRGEHTWDNWENYLCRFLKKIFWDDKF